MKRLLLLLIILLMTAAGALAQETTVLGHMADGEYIHQYIAPNGQMIWFTAMEKEPYIKLEDVNFDSEEDLVIFVIRGASNFFTEFFLYDAQRDMYNLATHQEENGICNYGLHPEVGIVEAQASNGSAGALHEYRLYRWEGTRLQCIRSAVSETLTETTHTGSTYTTTTYHDSLHLTVRHHELGNWDESVVWEKIMTIDEAVAQDVFEEEQMILWQGLK